MERINTEIQTAKWLIYSNIKRVSEELSIQRRLARNHPARLENRAEPCFRAYLRLPRPTFDSKRVFYKEKLKSQIQAFLPIICTLIPTSG